MRNAWQMLGVHFDGFDGRRYLLNAEKPAHYPEDDAVAEKILRWLLQCGQFFA